MSFRTVTLASICLAILHPEISWAQEPFIQHLPEAGVPCFTEPIENDPSTSFDEWLVQEGRFTTKHAHEPHTRGHSGRISICDSATGLIIPSVEVESYLMNYDGHDPRDFHELEVESDIEWNENGFYIDTKVWRDSILLAPYEVQADPHLYVLQSGRYEYVDNTFRQTTKLISRRRREVPVHWINDVTVGMKFDLMVQALEADSVRTEPYWGTCADDVNTAHSLWKDGKRIYVLWARPEEAGAPSIVYRMEVYTPEVKFGKGFTTATTFNELRALYPDLPIQTDSLSEYEYCYIPELDLRIVFDSTPNKPIGRYNDPEDPAIGIVNGDVKIGWVEVL